MNAARHTIAVGSKLVASTAATMQGLTGEANASSASPTATLTGIAATMDDT